MPDRAETIAICDSCGNPMNVAEMAPFANVVCPGCGAHSRVKRQFGPYTLIRRHAVGGMSMVFVAEDTTLHREVALKILSEEFSSDERRIASFEEEARITASFSHPHVVRVLTTGKAFGRLYIAMELVPGGHFEHQIRERGKIPEAEMLPLAIEIAEGLKAAHTAGLIHRDIKPGNILLDAENHAKIVDFGLALVTQGGKATASELWATPYYVPPETIEGTPEDFRSDIYAFGATLYHALAGVPSCGEETMSTTILREAKRKVIPLGTREPTLSFAICQIVDRAMAYDPKDRFSSYEEMISQLNSALKRLQSGNAASVEERESVVKRRARKKRDELAVLIAAGMVLMGSVAAGIWWVTREEPRKAPPLPLVFNNLPEIPEPGTAGATEITRSYREARAAVESGDFDAAGSRFAKLLENPEVQEPTRSWAGAEAVVAGYLAGDGAVARQRAFAVAEHLKSVAAERRPGEVLLGTLEIIPDLPGIPAARINPSANDAATVMSWMLAGLKDWEQGLIHEAAEYFSAVVAARLGENDGWLSVYQKIAGGYLSDQRTLSAPVFQALPTDVAGCDAAVAELETLLGGLHSRGRARFNIRAWQLDLKRQAKLLASPPVTAGDSSSWDEVMVMAKLGEFAAAGKFDDAAVYLKDLPAGLPETTRKSLLAMCGAAGEFLTDLRADLTQQPVTGEFPLRSGDVARQISANREGQIFILNSLGDLKTVEWGDFPADSLIALHRMLVKNATGDAQRMLRHERAISYDWIAGNRDRARQAAAQLAQSMPAFKERWDAISEGLPE